MKASQLFFDNLLETNPRTGMITFNHKRMVLVSVEALGLLRRDLINTLGIDRAKGFLMRYGWEWGKKDGESLTSMYKWKNRKELILAGPVLHTLEGVVTVEPDQIELNEDSLYFTGFWRNSFEAEEHIECHGHGSDEVCWILSGYASGYLTSTFGKDVIAYEEICVGKGDPYCQFTAKTVDQLEGKHKKYLSYYKAESLVSELDRAYRELNDINQNIVEADKFQQDLTDFLLEDRPLAETVEFVANSIQRSLVIDYYNRKIESAFSNDFDETVYNNWSDNFIYTEEKNNDISTFPIRANNINLGRLVVIGQKKMSQKDQLIINRALSVFTIQMYHDWKIARSLWKKKENFFEEIISNFDSGDFERFSHLFHFLPSNKNRVLSIKVEPAESRQDVMQCIKLNPANTNKDIFTNDDYIYIVLTNEEDRKPLDEATNMLSQLSKEFCNLKFYIGIGRESRDMATLKKSYEDSRSISDFIHLTNPASNIISIYEDVKSVMMFLKGTDQNELIDFYKKTIGELVDYDSSNQSNFLITLKTYLDNNGNLQQTADELHLSIAGLRYRLEKIEGLCDVDLKTGEGRFNCQLALQVYFAISINNSKNEDDDSLTLNA
ncbi:XylR N-terminal domain-containing protein [Siminovitchia terrae]|uniref:XylR N-terminal domain-containing protein n=1 Tax=Siminovitchia terrae TaxID=1914933 RepID=UPI0028B18410|nr:XylR N-terminal domain-containing protein [Siminovitchia terrae]